MNGVVYFKVKETWKTLTKQWSQVLIGITFAGYVRYRGAFYSACKKAVFSHVYDL